LIDPHIIVNIWLLLGFVAILLLLKTILGIALLGDVAYEHANGGVFGWAVAASERRAVAAGASTESISSSRSAHVD
jgi:hypothetical protein